MRQLSDADREAFLDAMETLYRMPTSEGNRVYGDEYKVSEARRVYLWYRVLLTSAKLIERSHVERSQLPVFHVGSRLGTGYRLLRTDAPRWRWSDGLRPLA